VAFGGIFAGCNPSYQKYELVHHIKTAKVQMLIVEPELFDGALAAAKECGIPREKILAFDNHDEKLPHGVKSWRTLLEHGQRDWERFDDERTSKSTIAALLFSSGTTGLPKAGVLTHYNFVAEHTLVHEHKPKPYRVCKQSEDIRFIPRTR